MTRGFQSDKNDSKQKKRQDFKRLTPEEYIAQRNQERSELYALLDEATEEVKNDPQKLESYLTIQARLDRYSVSNTLLIFKQMPDATQIKDSKAWGEDGVYIKKGEKHISIIEPVEREKGVFFNPKSVFDVSQTDSPKRRTAPDFSRTSDKVLIALFETAPVDIESVERFTLSDTLAEFRSDEGKLYVRKNAGDPVKFFQSVALELAFAELSVNSETFNRSAMAFDAVCVANMLCKKYGVPYERFQINDCPPAWKNASVKEVRDELATIREATSGICSRAADVLYRQNQQDRSQDKKPRSSSERER